ncbi:hypothetical protein VNI00_017107 [Paramarasmius palmivorus]|uniref:Uncharacterized protein n=1 Tax=Paramarasmius palmivorus TaxID=297713 RepID=A0AAW0B8P0_9AGAR
MSFSNPSRDLDLLMRVSVPVHQEFFCRLVEAYPRVGDGLLGSIRGADNNRALQLEMFLLRNFAEFPIHIQKRYSNIAMLTERFRRNVKVVLDTLATVIEGDTMRTYITGLAECPHGENAAERDLTSISTARLWSVEAIRLEGYLMFERDTQVDPMSALYDTYTLNWLRGGLATFLGVPVLHGLMLVHSADSVFEELMGGF